MDLDFIALGYRFYLRPLFTTTGPRLVSGERDLSIPRTRLTGSHDHYP